MREERGQQQARRDGVGQHAPGVRGRSGDGGRGAGKEAPLQHQRQHARQVGRQKCAQACRQSI